VAMIGEQHTAAAEDIKILFADDDLFQQLAADENRRWQDAIRGYLRFAAGKVVEIIYDVRFDVDFLCDIR
jgi:hypothetical protein